MKRLGFWFLIVTLTSQVQGAVPEPKGLWEFNGTNPNSATIGAPLEIFGSAEDAAGVNAEDGAMTIGEDSYYICTHGIAPNGGGAKVNEWTLLIDFSYPASSRSDPPNGYNDLFQTDPTNVSGPQLLKWILYLKNTGIGHSRIENHHYALKSFFAFLKKSGDIPSNPCRF